MGKASGISAQCVQHTDDWLVGQVSKASASRTADQGSSGHGIPPPGQLVLVLGRAATGVPLFSHWYDYWAEQPLEYLSLVTGMTTGVPLFSHWYDYWSTYL